MPSSSIVRDPYPIDVVKSDSFTVESYEFEGNADFRDPAFLFNVVESAVVFNKYRMPFGKLRNHKRVFLYILIGYIVPVHPAVPFLTVTKSFLQALHGIKRSELLRPLL